MSGFPLGLFGRGRLGSAIAAEAGPRLAWQVGREAAPEHPVPVAIEASKGPAVEGRLAWALETGTDLVIGSTGWEIPDLAERVGDRIGVLVAPNFSLTVALLQRLAVVMARFAGQDPRRDLYLTEHHHAAKADAPSGTARMLADLMVGASPSKRGWKVGGALSPSELSVGVVRAGSTYSTHTLGLDAPGEVLELQHTARSAQPFAEGALLAADWLRGRKGVYAMSDVAADRLDPLFAGGVL